MAKRQNAPGSKPAGESPKLKPSFSSTRKEFGLCFKCVVFMSIEVHPVSKVKDGLSGTKGRISLYIVHCCNHNG